MSAAKEKDLLEVLEKLTDKVSNLDKTMEGFRVSLEHYESNADRLHEEMKRNNDILQNNTESLKEHMAQTAMLKETVVKIDERLSPIELERIKKQAIREWRWNATVVTSKVVGFLLGSGGLVWGIMEILAYLHGKVV